MSERPIYYRNESFQGSGLYNVAYRRIEHDFTSKKVSSGPKSRALAIAISCDNNIVIAFPYGKGFSYGAHEICHSALRSELGEKIRLIMHGEVVSTKKGNNEKAEYGVNIFQRNKLHPNKDLTSIIPPWEAALVNPRYYLSADDKLTQSILFGLEALTLTVTGDTGTTIYFQKTTKDERVARLDK